MDNVGYTGGVSPELAQAIQSRQGQPAPGMQPQSAPPMGGQAPMPFNPMEGQQVPPQAPTMDAGMGMPQTPESQIIIKALDGRLKSLSKQDEMKLNGGM